MPWLCLFFAALFILRADAQSLSGTGGNRLRLLQHEEAGLRFRLNGSELAIPARRDGVEISKAAGKITIQSLAESLLVESDLGRWTLYFPPKSQAALEYFPALNTFKVEVPAGNPAPLEMTFSDNAIARLLPPSAGQLDLFADGTYSFRATTNVPATTADGQTLALSNLHPPLLGGDLREVPGVGGVPRFQRATPAIQIHFAGAVNGNVRVDAAGSKSELLPGQEKLLNFQNGTKVILHHNLAKQQIEWQIIKGICHFKIDGFNCWKSSAMTGQSGSLQWNPVRKIVDFANHSATPVFVQLSGRMTASVGAGATFQYSQFQDCGSFTTSAAGGDVFLNDRDTGEATPIAQSQSYVEGARAGAEAASTEAHAIRFDWPADTRVELRGDFGLLGIGPGEEETIAVGHDELRLNFENNGELVLRAKSGAFDILPKFIPELALNMPEGAAVTLNLKRARNLFTARPASESAASTRVLAMGRTYMFLSGPAKLSVVIGQNTFIPEGAAAWIFFEGAGGEATFTSGRQPAPSIRDDRFDGSRIFQQPVSVIE